MEHGRPAAKGRDHRASVRLHVMPDPDDPLLFLVTSEPVDSDAIPVIPTARAHSHWVRTSLNIDNNDPGSDFSTASPGRTISLTHPSHVDHSRRADDSPRLVR
jgi:hypothetical protein